MVAFVLTVVGLVVTSLRVVDVLRVVAAEDGVAYGCVVGWTGVVVCDGVTGYRVVVCCFVDSFGAVAVVALVDSGKTSLSVIPCCLPGVGVLSVIGTRMIGLSSPGRGVDELGS